MKYHEIIVMSEQDKKKKIADLKLQLVKLNLQVSTGTTLKKPKEIRELKKDIARIFTSLNKKNVGKNKN
jgi:ribosomal protein L29